MRRYWVFFIVFILLTPLGLLAEGTAWGEWGTDELGKMMGFVPQGVEKGASWWQALLPDYNVPFLGEGRWSADVGYVISAIFGSATVYALTLIYSKMLTKPGRKS